MRARLHVEGLEAAIARLDEIGDRARAPQPVLRSPGVKFDLQQSERRKFARGGWRVDTPTWIATKRRRGMDSRTLRATGRLESAMVNATDGVDARVTGTVLTWGLKQWRSRIYYAAPLAKGWNTGHGQVPKRRMVVVDPVAKVSIAGRIGRYITDGVT
jgi:hypothetical protein